LVDETADGDRDGAANAETQEEKEEIAIVAGRLWPKTVLGFTRLSATSTTGFSASGHSRLYAALVRKG